MTISQTLTFDEEIDKISDDIATELSLITEDPKNIPDELLPRALKMHKQNMILYWPVWAGVIVAGIMAGDKMGGLVGGLLFLGPAIHGIIQKRKIADILANKKTVNT